MSGKRGDGDETWHRLLSWTKQQAPAERLSGHILRLDGFSALDPSHPLGGKDGLKDLVAVRDGEKWIAAAYFPRGQQTCSTIKEKYKNDILGVENNQAAGFVFVTNQEIKLAERRDLIAISSGISIEIYHLERIASILDTPPAYGIRLEYLDISMSKEDQVSFFCLAGIAKQ